MKTEIQIKIKLSEGKEIILDDVEARELYNKLENIYATKEYVYQYPKHTPIYKYPEHTKWTCSEKQIYEPMIK